MYCIRDKRSVYFNIKVVKFKHLSHSSVIYFNNFYLILMIMYCSNIYFDVILMGQNISGWMSFVLKEKLKGLKLVLKEWSREEYGGIEDRVEKLVEDIKDLDEKGEEGGLTEVEVGIRKLKFEELWRLLKAKDALMAQRSRSR